MTSDRTRVDSFPRQDAFRRYVFGIGVETYRDGWEKLPHVSRDVATIVSALGEFGYRAARSHAQGLIDPPTGVYIQEELLKWVDAEGLEEDDMVVVYHAGHGENEAEHYLICSRTDSGLSRIPVTALSTSRLVELLGDAGIHRLLLILDTCYAGDGAAEAMALAAKNQLVEKAAFPARQRRHWRSLEVLAAARSGETAKDGLFATILAGILRDEVVDDRILAGERAPYILLSDVVRAVNRVFERGGIPQRADHAQIHDDGIGFIPNPRYIAGIPGEIDIAEQRAYTAQRRTRIIERIEHFGPRARGVHSSSQAGHYFTGRTKVLTRLASWLRGSDEENIRVFQVTGGPGTGKSSILGRVVALSDQSMRASIPDSTVLLSTDVPAGVINVAIHAAHRTIAEILAALGEALGTTDNEPTTLIRALRAHIGPFTAVIDALDETGAGGTGSDFPAIMSFLRHASARVPQLRLLLGGRNHVFSNYPVSSSVARIDLDEARWSEHADIVSYSAALLGAPHGPGSETGIAEPLAARAAADIADIAGRNYLITRLIARALADLHRDSWGSAPGDWVPLLPGIAPAGTSQAEGIGIAFRWALEALLGAADAIRARALLSPLAYARGAGLPLAVVWTAAARAFTGQAVTEYDLTQLLASDAAAPYIVESLDESGRSVYRLYHQALVDDLRIQAEAAHIRQTDDVSGRSRSHRNLQVALFEHLYNAAPRTSEGQRDWQHADPYLLEHLPAHAADADRVHVLLGDVEYLIYAEPAALAQVLDQARTPRGRLAAAIYRSCYDQLRNSGPDIRLWALACSAARFGATQFKEQLWSANPNIREGMWPRWSTGSPQPALRNTMVGQISPAHAISCTTINERPAAVTASYDPFVRVWDLSNGQPIGSPLEGHTEEVRGVACTILDGTPIAVTSGYDGTLRIWDLERGQQIRQAVVAHSGDVSAVACAMVGTAPVAITAGNYPGGLHAWDLARTRLIGKPFRKSPGNLLAVDCGILNGRPIVVGGGGSGSVLVWDLETRELIGEPFDEFSWAGEVQGVTCTIVNGSPVAVIVNGESYGESIIWVLDLERRREMKHYFVPNGYTSSVACTAINGRPAAVTVGYSDGIIESWDLVSHRRIGKKIKGPSTGCNGFTTATINDRPVAITGSNDNLIQVWDLSQSREIGRSLPGHDRHIRGVACTEIEGRPTAVTAGEDARIRMWDLLRGEQIASIPADNGKIDKLSCATAPGGQPFAISKGFLRSKVGVWNLSRREQVSDLRGGSFSAITSSLLDGRAIAVTSSERELQLWDLERDEQVGALSTGSETMIDLACINTPDRQAIVVGFSESAIWQWNLNRLVRTAEPLRHSLTHYATRPGGIACAWAGHDLIAVSIHTVMDAEAMIDSNFEIYKGEVRLWNLSRRRLVGEFATTRGDVLEGVECTCYHGRPVAFTGGRDRFVRMWDLTEKKLARKWPVHGFIKSISSSTDGALVLGIDSDIQVVDFN
jgi:WD40 repeat protein